MNRTKFTSNEFSTANSRVKLHARRILVRQCQNYIRSVIKFLHERFCTFFVESFVQFHKCADLNIFIYSGGRFISRKIITLP